MPVGNAQASDRSHEALNGSQLNGILYLLPMEDFPSSLTGQSVELTCVCRDAPSLSTSNCAAYPPCCLPAQDHHGRNPLLLRGGITKRASDWCSWLCPAPVQQYFEVRLSG